ncbi:sensor histidine kinase [Maledivibacter halophilus]|uniref:histidine kinase n=1 Tax=Maledivibacter halophilus TaxID=36842 RepID=A0A1T5LCN3_9FIRM|nr:HAMP domain-containing sensor histidine kinase [Maledivibacter halophilus]SKC73465.1 Histidine kinase-, DNA gyrase B-, and HSP90-like ATPase [Maledivibacter halophilus]
MTTAKLSINKACIIVCTLLVLLSVLMITVLYLLTDNLNVIWGGILFSVLVFFCLVLFIILIRQKLTAFSDTLCRLLDDMMTGEIEPPQIAEEESLFYKINHRLTRLYEVMRENRRSIAKERADLQGLISDISHQVKTPIANLKMVNSTLLEQSMPEEKRKEFLSACGGQLDKLDFLMQAMIKTSRLEAGIISLEKKKQSIYDTLAAALGGILLNAEQKHITVDIDCKESLEVSHDRKWTSEALFNILDNAVKYTPNGGCIRVAVEIWEMFLKIDITDTGKGIPEIHQAKIFKRFYREKEVHDTPGIGIGLYLAREIITMQGGYIRVASEIGQGSTFSVFLPRK